MACRDRLAAAVRVEDRVLGKQSFQAGKVTLLGRGEKSLEQAASQVRVGVEARSRRREMLPRSRNQLSAVHWTAPDDRRDLGVGVVEDDAQQEGGTLDGRELLEYDEEGLRE